MKSLPYVITHTVNIYTSKSKVKILQINIFITVCLFVLFFLVTAKEWTFRKANVLLCMAFVIVPTHLEMERPRLYEVQTQKNAL